MRTIAIIWLGNGESENGLSATICNMRAVPTPKPLQTPSENNFMLFPSLRDDTSLSVLFSVGPVNGHGRTNSRSRDSDRRIYRCNGRSDPHHSNSDGLFGLGTNVASSQWNCQHAETEHKNTTQNSSSSSNEIWHELI